VTKEGVMNQLYTRNQFAVCKEKLLFPGEEVATMTSPRPYWGKHPLQFLKQVDRNT